MPFGVVLVRVKRNGPSPEGYSERKRVSKKGVLAEMSKAKALFAVMLCSMTLPAQADTRWWDDCPQLSAFATLVYRSAWEWDLPEDRFIIPEETHDPEEYRVKIAIKHEAYHAPQALRLRVQMACAKKESS
jgi:hypothetical protein